MVNDNSLLSSEEKRALLDESEMFDESSGRSTSMAEKVPKSYNFKRPDKFSKEQIRTLSIIYETFGRLLAGMLSTDLRSLVNISLVHLDQKVYKEYISTVPQPTVLGLVELQPLAGNALFEMDSLFTFVLIDRLFGGGGSTLYENRELTPVEQAVVHNLFTRILNVFKEAWAHIIELTPKVYQIEVNPHFVQIVPPGEMTIVAYFSISIGNVKGTFNICLPYVILEHISSKLTTKYWYSSGITIKDKDSFQIKRNLFKTPIAVVAKFAQTQLSLKELSQLKSGDMIQFNNAQVNQPISIYVGGKKKFLGQPCVHNKHYAILVEKKLKNAED